MSISSLKLDRYVAIAYLTMIFGIIGDHITTSIGLSRDGIKEGNQIALELMKKGIWAQTDVMLVAVLILLPLVWSKVLKCPLSRMYLVPMLIVGLARLTAMLLNISLIM